MNDVCNKLANFSLYKIGGAEAGTVHQLWGIQQKLE